MSDAERNPASVRVKDEPVDGDQQQRREVTGASVSDDDEGDTPPSLRDYQKEAIAAFHEARRFGLNRIGISAPTGSGKTIIFSTILRQVLENHRGGKALVLVGTQEQAIQARNKILDVYGENRVTIGYEKSSDRADRRDDV
jgi:ATP-dependent helicase IRC3